MTNFSNPFSRTTAPNFAEYSEKLKNPAYTPDEDDEAAYDLYLAEQEAIANEVIDAYEREQEERYEEGDW